MPITKSSGNRPGNDEFTIPTIDAGATIKTITVHFEMTPDPKLETFIFEVTPQPDAKNPRIFWVYFGNQIAPLSPDGTRGGAYTTPIGARITVLPA